MAIVEANRFNPRNLFPNNIHGALLHQAEMRLGVKSPAEEGMKMFDIQVPMEYLMEIADYVKNGHVVVIYSNHRSHADGAPIAEITSRIRTILGDSTFRLLMPIASGIGAGVQGDVPKELVDKSKPWMSSKGLDLIDVTRDKDLEDGVEELNEENMELMMNAYLNGYGGIAIFPEGSVEAVRIDELTHKKKGRQPITKMGLASFVRKARIRIKKIVFLALGMSQSERLTKPDKKPTVEAWIYLGLNKLFEKIGLDPLTLATVTANRPFTLEDLEEEVAARGAKLKDYDVVNEILMEKVDEILPIDERRQFD